MSIYSLDTLSKPGALRLAAELLVVFGVVSLAYVVAVEPLLRSVAPGVYVQPGLDYSRTDLPNTASEITHLLLIVAAGGSFLFWRLNHTELGERFSDAVMEESGTE